MRQPPHRSPTRAADASGPTTVKPNAPAGRPGRDREEKKKKKKPDRSVAIRQLAQPPTRPGEPSVLNDEPQAHELTALGLLMAKPEPMSEST